MELKNVVSNEELEIRLSNLRNDNWKIDNMAKGLNGNAKQIIDNWFGASREMMLKMLKIEENKEYKYVYHEVN